MDLLHWCLKGGKSSKPVKVAISIELSPVGRNSKFADTYRCRIKGGGQVFWTVITNVARVKCQVVYFFFDAALPVWYDSVLSPDEEPSQGSRKLLFNT